MAEPNYKILLIGDAGVGKSSILVRFVNDTFTEGVEPATGIDSLNKNIDIDGKRVKLQIWDTAGQERFRTITSSYYRGAHGVLIVYDVCDHTSFENTRRWIGEIDRYAGEDQPLKMLVGTKVDMDTKRTVATSDGQELADQLQIPFKETSAKTKANLDDVFQTMGRLLLKRNNNEPAGGAPKQQEPDLAQKVQLQQNNEKKPKSKKTCFIL